jgi:hypothetical protein
MLVLALAVCVCFGVGLWFVLADEEPHGLYLSAQPHHLCPEICETLLKHLYDGPRDVVDDDKADCIQT